LVSISETRCDARNSSGRNTPCKDPDEIVGNLLHLALDIEENRILLELDGFELKTTFIFPVRFELFHALCFLSLIRLKQSCDTRA